MCLLQWSRRYVYTYTSADVHRAYRDIYTNLFTGYLWICQSELYNSECSSHWLNTLLGCCPFKCWDTFITTVLFHFALGTVIIAFIQALESGMGFFTVHFLIHWNSSEYSVKLDFVTPLFMLGTPLCLKEISWSKHAVYFSLFSDFFVFVCTGDVNSTHVNTKNIFGLTSKLLYRHNWLKNGKERQLICGLRWGNIYTQCFFTDSWSFFILLWCL